MAATNFERITVNPNQMGGVPCIRLGVNGRGGTLALEGSTQYPNQCIAIRLGQATELPNDSALRQHSEFVNADEGSHIQPRHLPLLDREVIFREPWPRGDGRCHEIVVFGVQKNNGRTHFPARGLVKLHPQEN